MYDLSSFYRDYSPDYEYYQYVFKIYEEIVQMITEYMKQVDANRIISTVETYRTIPIQYAQMDEASYEMSEIMSDSVIVKKYGLDTKTMQERTDFFNNASIDIQKEILITSGKYLLLSTSRNGALDKTPPSIIDFELFDQNGEKLVRNE
jgi:hypothetical protein